MYICSSNTLHHYDCGLHHYDCGLHHYDCKLLHYDCGEQVLPVCEGGTQLSLALSVILAQQNDSARQLVQAYSIAVHVCHCVPPTHLIPLQAADG